MLDFLQVSGLSSYICTNMVSFILQTHKWPQNYFSFDSVYDFKIFFKQHFLHTLLTSSMIIEYLHQNISHAIYKNWLHIDLFTQVSSKQIFRYWDKALWFVTFNDKFVTYIILCTKYFIYKCKFKDKNLDINGLKSFIKLQREIEYNIA